MERFLKIAGISVFVLLFAVVSLNLFYPDFYMSFGNKGNSNNGFRDRPNETLVIALDGGFSELEPTYYDMATRNRLLQIYEPLLMPDKDLNFKPLLALNYGRLDDLTWKFRLRKGVKFHDGQDLKVEDVIASVTRAKTYEKSQLKDILNTISSVRKINENEFRVLLFAPDPLFLNRISTVLIIPEKFADGGEMAPTGTGPYSYVSDQNSSLNLKRFELYWGKKPSYGALSISKVTDLSDWGSLFEKKDFDVAVSLPPSLISSVDSEAYRITPVPSLAVTFLVFNFDSDVFGKADVRKALRLTMDNAAFSKLFGNSLSPASQFVSGGVYGFSPNISVPEVDIELAKQYVSEALSSGEVDVTLDLLDGDKPIGDYIKKQADLMGINVNLNLLSMEKFRDKISSRKSDLYIFGFRSELGDAYDFYSSAVYTDSVYNGGNYSSSLVDKKIDESLTLSDSSKRLKLLNEIMEIIVDKDVYGIPLFESKFIYVISNNALFEPRIDGYVLAKEIK